jgi:acyl carrier protein
LHAQIVSLMADRLNVQVPSAETDLLETGMLDSLAFVGLLVHLEREFNTQMSIEDIEIDDFRSVARIADFLVTNRGITLKE